MLGSNRKFLALIIGLIVIFVVLAWLKPRDAQQDAVTTSSNGVSIQAWETDNGARVLFVPTKQLPMLDVRVVFDAGSARDGQKPGLARLTNLLLAHGAGEWDTDTIAERFEDVGATYGAQASRDMAVVSLRSLVDEPLLEQALTTLEQVLQNPRFEADEFEREQTRTMVALQNERQSPSSVAEKAFYANLFQQHPYHSPPTGEETTVAELTVGDVSAFYERFYVAKNAVIAIVGAIDRAQAEQIANRLTRNLRAGEPAPELPDVGPATSAEKIRRDFPSTQSHILIGQPGMRRGDPDYFPLYVGNHVLGGSGFGSRIVEEIREKRGLAYSSYSYFLPMRKDGPFIIGMQTRNGEADQALQILNETLTGFINEGPTAEELLHAKKNITGGFPLRIDSNKDIIEYIGMIGFYGLPLDHLQTFNAKINAVTAEQIRDAFQRRVHPDKLLTVVVGKNTDAQTSDASPTGS